MLKNIKITFILFLITTSFYSNLYSNENLIEELKKGEKIVFIRHAIAPGSGDPNNFKLNDCGTQRNLDHNGIRQSKKIGLFFLRNNIPIDLVLSSEWCRCVDTAKFAFENFETFNALNSFFSPRFQKNKENQMLDLYKYIDNWKGKKNLILITHYVVILETLDKAVSSGEMVISDKNLNFIGSIINY
tara:strand:+ start:558 stop:1118 length:561 start_codon:yes stop_codon:yes gene_type:complete